MNSLRGTSRNVYINRSDWREKDEKGYFGFAPGKECKLKYAYNVTITGVLERDEQGRAMKLSATYDETKANKCKVLTWLADGEGGKKPDSVTVRLYENLFKSPTCSPSDAAPGDSEAWLRDVDHESKRTVEAFVDDSVMQNSAPLTRFQFERIGYFVVDISNSESSEGKLLMNRTLPSSQRLRKRKQKQKELS